MPTIDDVLARRVRAPRDELAADAYASGFVEGLIAAATPQALEQIHCAECGEAVSTAVPAPTIVRAYVICPECLEAWS
jgi:hypothetical protein